MQEINSRHSTWRKLMPVELWVMAWGYLPQSDRIHASHVCTAWRTIMLSTTRLWTHLHLKIASLAQKEQDEQDEEDKEDEEDEKDERLTTTEPAILPLLHRSKDLPLSFTVEILEHGAQIRQQVCLSIVGRSLGQAVHRVQHLRIICDKPSTVATIISDLGADLYQLQTLTCESVTDESDEWAQNEWEDPYYRPRRNDTAAVPFYDGVVALPCDQLRKLEFSPPTAFLWWPRFTDMTTLEQLTSLEITAHRANDIRRAVQACPNLGVLILHTREVQSYDYDISPEYYEDEDCYSGSCGYLQTIVAHTPRSFCLDFLAEGTRKTVDLCYLDHREGYSEEGFDRISAVFEGLTALEGLNPGGPLAVHIKLDDDILFFRLEDSTTGRTRVLSVSLYRDYWSVGINVETLVDDLRRRVIKQADVHQLDVALALSSCPDTACAILNGLFGKQKKLAGVRRWRLELPPGFKWIEPFRKFRWLKSLPVAEELIFDDGTSVHSFDGAASFVGFMASHGVEQPATPERKTVPEEKDWWAELGLDL